MFCGKHLWCIMWNPFVVDNHSYLIKYIRQSSVKLQITDFKSIWLEEIAINELIARFQELNSLLDVDSLSSEDILNHSLSAIDNINLNTTSIILTKEADQIVLEIKCKLPVFFIRCKFNLTICDADVYFNDFTIPLIQSVQYLEARQKKLFDLLEKKDKEIQEHELERGEISRKSLVTKKFKREQLVESAPQESFLNVFGKSKEFLETFTKIYGNINSKVKMENGESSPKKKKNNNK